MTAPLPFYIDADDPPAKREIMRAALVLFSGRGLAGTTIRDIAKESGYTNPALYKHFASKEDLALHLFEICHARVWSTCARALAEAEGFDDKLEAFVGTWLGLLDDEPEVLAFLADSARVLWPRARATIRRNTMIGLTRLLVRDADGVGRGRIDPDVAAASVQGALSELGRMIQVGAVDGPARRWRGKLVTLFRQLLE
jgi:TetR/AcrR family transcriptional regulator, repressor of fatR-cypB operon